MDEAALERARRRISGYVEGRPETADLAAALERSREQIEALAAAAAELEAGIPVHVGDAVREGLRAEVLPVGRHIAEMRGLFNQVVRRLERIEGDLLAERNARVDDLVLLVDLVTSGWRGVDTRLARLEDGRVAPSAPASAAPASVAAELVDAGSVLELDRQADALTEPAGAELAGVEPAGADAADEHAAAA